MHPFCLCARAGQGRARQGRAGQGRAGQGRVLSSRMGPPRSLRRALHGDGIGRWSDRPVHFRETLSVLTLTTSLRRASHAMASGHLLMTKNSTGVLSSLGRAARSADPKPSMLE